MEFKLKNPCKECPFRKDLPEALKGWLGKLRAEQIIADHFFHGATFPCHKTTSAIGWDDEENKDGYVFTGDEIPCAGAAIMQIKNDNPSQWMQVSSRLNIKTEIEKLDLNSPVFETPEDFIKFHSEDQA